MIKIGDYNAIMADRNIFNQIVYTPLSEALRLLEERQKDKELMAKVKKLLKDEIPEIFEENKKYAVQFRQVAVLNKEGDHFIKISKENNLKPVFFEYHDDKFTSNNAYKHSIGQLRILSDHKKKYSMPLEKVTIVDFNNHNGSKLKDVFTLWNEKLIDFHRRVFDLHGHKKEDLYFYDASEWFKKKGGKASEYYFHFFLIFVCYGILFENFLTTDDSEGDFSRNIILPTLERVINETGVKPLIVPLEPIDSEDEEYWISFHENIRNIIN
jgi:hypothetical protein